MSDDMDGRYASAREHWQLVERVATTEADMRQIGPALARIETMVATRSQPPQQQETAAALALHRAADMFERTKQSGNGVHPAILTLAIVGAFAIGAVVMYFMGKIT